MKSPHPPPEAFEQYVLGALGPEAAAALEHHTLDCQSCTLALQREALLEERLREVARAPAPPATVLRPARWRRPPPVASALAALLAAAAAVLVLLPRPEPQRSPATPEDVPELALSMDLPEHPPRLVACPDPTSQDTCAAEALARGLLVQYPQGVGDVPRYEGHAGLPTGALASRPSLL